MSHPEEARVKALIHSNSPWAPTGYGQQTALLAQQLREHGHDVAVSAFYGLNGTVMDYDGIRVYPGLRDPYGNDVLTAHAAHWFDGDPRAGVVITLVDAWILDPKVLRGLHVAAWAPVDHDPIPPKVAGHLATGQVLPVAMSRHGEQAMTAAGLAPMYAPHAVDTTEMRPVDQREAREVLGLPTDAFIVGMVAANKGTPSRKGFSEAIQAFARLLKDRADAFLYLHTEATGMFDGVDLRLLLAACEIPQDRVRFSDQYASQVVGESAQHMRTAYSAMDVLLNPAHGEGFGVPVLEAQACGTPVIVQDFTAMAEIGNVGWHVDGQRSWTAQNSWQRVASVDAIAWALTEAATQASRLRDEAVRFAQGYDASSVFVEHWLPILDRMRERVEGPEPSEPAPAVALVEQVAA